MKRKVREMFWWPGLDRMIEDLVKTCLTCQCVSKSVKPAKSEVDAVPLPSSPWYKLAIDIKGPLQGKAEFRYAICVMDYFSKFPEVKFVSAITSATVIRFLKELFMREGLCAELVTDNGRQFVSKEFESFLAECGIKHIRTSLYCPSSNGMIERFNRSLGDAIEIAKKEGGDFRERINQFLSMYRSVPHSVTGFSPSLLLHGREMKTRANILPLAPSEYAPKVKQNCQKRVRFRDVDECEDNPFEVGDRVKFIHPRTRDVVFGSVQKLAGSKAVILKDLGTWNVAKLAPVLS